jgi:hypothetical protein
MYPIYTSAGGYLFGKGAEGDYDPKDLGLSKPEAVKAFEKIGELGEKGDGALKRSIAAENVTSLLTGKKTAFLLSGPWQIPDVEKSGVKYEITPIPGFQGGQEVRPFVGVQAMVSEGGPFPPGNPSIGATDILITYTYRLAFGGQGAQYGFAAAVSWLIFLIVAVISIVGFRRTRALGVPRHHPQGPRRVGPGRRGHPLPDLLWASASARPPSPCTRRSRSSVPPWPPTSPATSPSDPQRGHGRGRHRAHALVRPRHRPGHLGLA